MKPLLSVVFALLITSLVGLSVGTNLTSASPKEEAEPLVRFTDVSEELGVEFLHQNGMMGNDRYYPEIMGGGGAFFDYDGDGDLDLFFVNGGVIPGLEDGKASSDKLYRNHKGKEFVDVTEEAGLGNSGYGQGCCAADYDGDGDLDLYVTCFGPNRLYRNDGDGRFEEVAGKLGVDDPLWGQACSFADLDQDGDLDLYLQNYLIWTPEKHRVFKEKNNNLIAWDYAHPSFFEGAPDRLYLQKDDGSFEDATEKSGLLRPEGKGMGVMISDFDDSGSPDIFVSNDAMPNYLFRGLGQGKFEETGLIAGVAVDGEGRRESSMGVDLGDVDGDGRLDMIVPCLPGQTHTLYRNDGEGLFTDFTVISGVAKATLGSTGYGPVLFDFDNDADLDLFISCGAVAAPRKLLFDENAGYADRYAEPDLLLENTGGGKFRDISSTAGPYFDESRISRGVAAGDYDNDGDLDLVVVNLNDQAVLLRNDTESSHHWVRIELRDKSMNPQGIGARVSMVTETKTQVAEVKTSSSYLSQGDTRLHFGLGTEKKIERVEVRWPDGEVEIFDDVSEDKTVRLRRGTGKPPKVEEEESEEEEPNEE